MQKIEFSKSFLLLHSLTNSSIVKLNDPLEIWALKIIFGKKFNSFFSVAFIHVFSRLFKKTRVFKNFQNIPKKKLGGLLNFVSARHPNNMLISYSHFFSAICHYL